MDRPSYPLKPIKISCFRSSIHSGKYPLLDLNSKSEHFSLDGATHYRFFRQGVDAVDLPVYLSHVYLAL